MRVAIIDVGSNNIKLEVFEIDEKGNSQLIYDEKVAARLGHDVFVHRKLNPKNMEIAIEGLKNIARILKSLQVERTFALGTAALREADSQEFVTRARKETGIKIRVISGIEEARLVHNAVLAYTPFEGRTFFLNDIGGGSTEISVSNGKLLFVESLRLGTVRLKELFASARDDKEAYQMMERYVDKILAPYLGELLRHKIDMGISTGGTARNLCEIVRSNGGTKEEEKGIPVLYTRDLKDLVSQMKKMTPKEILKLQGLDSARADIIVPGGILLLGLLQNLRIDRSLVSNRGLRDGALIDYIYHKVNKKIYQERQNEYRKRGLEIISNKYNIDKKHAEQTAKLALMLFRILKALHNLPQKYEEILYGAALLHDTGRIIDYANHHKHSQYLIQNSAILGFSDHEKTLMALIARYHRKSMPKSTHIEFQTLSPPEQQVVTKLAALLRLADSLDRSYSSSVKNITVKNLSSDKVHLVVEGRGDLALELWSVEKKKDFFEKTFGRRLKVEKV
ncbi:MAG: Ppx/GppA family phosphatase [Leptospiraceae bacterium]|nr:Ppx/GppA family phosphatase [Leptospiraceae bacterium]MDW8306345.1 Ppx/GppA phosphatase family protein [Leptospiraceae bacterium]